MMRCYMNLYYIFYIILYYFDICMIHDSWLTYLECLIGFDMNLNSFYVLFFYDWYWYYDIYDYDAWLASVKMSSLIWHADASHLIRNTGFQCARRHPAALPDDRADPGWTLEGFGAGLPAVPLELAAHSALLRFWFGEDWIGWGLLGKHFLLCGPRLHPDFEGSTWRRPSHQLSIASGRRVAVLTILDPAVMQQVMQRRGGVQFCTCFQRSAEHAWETSPVWNNVLKTCPCWTCPSTSFEISSEEVWGPVKSEASLHFQQMGCKVFALQLRWWSWPSSPNREPVWLQREALEKKGSSEVKVQRLDTVLGSPLCVTSTPPGWDEERLV